MKKIMALLCALLMALSFVSCEDSSKKTCEHKWMDATCEEPKTCSRCDKTEGKALGHTWEDATCTAPKTCSVCEKTEGKALGHTWEDATCTEPKTCSVCEKTEGKALGHTWEDATCTDPKTCSTCKETEGEALGHDWDVQNCMNCSEMRNVAYKSNSYVPDFGYVFPTYLEPMIINEVYCYDIYFISSIDPDGNCFVKYKELLKDFGFVQVFSDDNIWAYMTPSGKSVALGITGNYFAVSFTEE